MIFAGRLMDGSEIQGFFIIGNKERVVGGLRPTKKIQEVRQLKTSPTRQLSILGTYSSNFLNDLRVYTAIILVHAPEEALLITVPSGDLFPFIAWWIYP